MRVSAKSDYALRALIEMASRIDGKAVSAEELGKQQEIPHGFLQAILADLRRAGIVMSQRGQSGGWRMGRAAGDVSVADVIRAVDGPLVSVYGLRPEAVSYNETAEVLQHVWIAARHSLRDVFEHVSIQQLADGKLPRRSRHGPPTRTPGSRTSFSTLASFGLGPTTTLAALAGFAVVVAAEADREARSLRSPSLTSLACSHAATAQVGRRVTRPARACA